MKMFARLASSSWCACQASTAPLSRPLTTIGSLTSMGLHSRELHGRSIPEGGTLIVPIDATNEALRLDSSDPSGLGYNEWYIGPIVVSELVGASRFRLVDFSPNAKENLLAVTVGGGMPTAPSITLVDGRFKVWSYTSDQEILGSWPRGGQRISHRLHLARDNGTAGSGGTARSSSMEASP